MRCGVPIVDVDRHVMEPMGLWREYLPSRFSEYAPSVSALADPDEDMASRLERLGDHALLPTPPVVSVQGEPIWGGMTEVGYIEVGLHAAGRRADLVAAESAAGQLRSMDEQGIDYAVLLPTYAGYLVYDDARDAELSRAYASAYNHWLSDECDSNPVRLCGAAIISRHRPETMPGDLEAGLKAGLGAAVLRPNPVLGRTLGHPEYEPFFAACEAADVPVLLHEGAHTRVATAGADRFRTHFAQHACSHPMEAMMAFLSLLEGGVLERHPKLRVAFLEAGCGWLPYWLWRLDELEFAQLRNEVSQSVRIKPSEYFRRQCWIAFEPEEALLAESITALGDDRVVFGSDFPHVDHDDAILDSLFDAGSPLAVEMRKRALWLNPSRLMKLDPERLFSPHSAGAG